MADTYDEAVRQVLEAGLNVRTDFTSPADFILPIRRLLQEKKLSIDIVNKRVAEVLRVKFRLGLFDHPYVEVKEADKVGGMAHNLNFVKQIQAEALVLLKNEQHLLPLDKKQMQHAFLFSNRSHSKAPVCASISSLCLNSLSKTNLFSSVLLLDI